MKFVSVKNVRGSRRCFWQCVLSPRTRYQLW